MSSSFVKDCSDVSAPRNSSSGKTVIIIVNETGNVSLDQDELQSLLATHGADGSQVSVVRMGSGGVIGNVSDVVTNPSIVTAADGTAHVNLSIEGYPAIPLEGHVGGGMNYAELPLDQDAFQRLESVLDSEEAREILGEPLLNMVANPDQLGTFDQLMDSSLFEGADPEDVNSAENQSESNFSKKSRSPPKRRSQRQMDKAEREEVEKILAENQKLLQEEKQQLNEQQVLEKMQKMNTVDEKEEEDSADDQEEEQSDDEVASDESGDEEEKGKTTSKDNKKTAGMKKRGKKTKSDVGDDKPKGKGRGRGRGKTETEKTSPQDSKGKGKGRRKIEDEEPEVVGIGRGRSKSRGNSKEDTVGTVKGRGRGIAKKDEKETGLVGRKKLGPVSDAKNNNSLGRRKMNENVKDDKDAEESKNKLNIQKNAKKSDSDDREDKGNKKQTKQSRSDKSDSDDVERKLVDILNARNSDSSKDEKESDGGENKKVKGKKNSKLMGNENERIASDDDKFDANSKRKFISGTDKNDTEEEKNSESHDSEQENSSGTNNRDTKKRTQKKSGKKNTDDDNAEIICDADRVPKKFAVAVIDEKMDMDDSHSQDENIVADFNSASKGLQIKSLKVSVEKINVQQAIEKELLTDICEDDSFELPDLTAFPNKSSGSKDIKGILATPKLVSNFKPTMSSTPVAASEDTKVKSGPKGIKIKSHKIVVGNKVKHKKVEENSEISQSDDNGGISSQNFEIVKIKTNINESSQTHVTVKAPETGESEVDANARAKCSKKEESVTNTKSNTDNNIEMIPRKLPEKISITEGKSRLIQVRSPTGVRQVVVLSAAKPAMNKETLVKVIDPIDPPREEDRLSVAKLCANAKKEATQKRKLELQRKKSRASDLSDAEAVEPKEKREDLKPDKVMMVKEKGKTDFRSTKTETQRKDPPPKIVDLEMDLEDPLLLKKREAQRKREEIQRKREEILRKREAIKLRKEQQMKESQMKREESRENLQIRKEENTDHVKHETKSEKPIPKTKDLPLGTKNQPADALKRLNSQETPPKREVKVTVLSNKGPGTPKCDIGENTKNKDQGSITKNPFHSGTPKGKVKVLIAKNSGSVKKNVSKEPEDVPVHLKKSLVKKAEMTRKKGHSNVKKISEEPSLSVIEESPVRRSGRAIKKKNFGDEMVTFDLKEDIAPGAEEEPASEDEFGSEGEEEEDEDYEDYDDPDRLWCICQKPHNNRFMICCDRCEDWFHGSCVGITKAMGQQMEDEGQEWVCPKCKKADKAMKGIATASKKVDAFGLNRSEMASASVSGSQNDKTVTRAAATPKKIVESDSKKTTQPHPLASKKVTASEKKVDAAPGSSKMSLNAASDDLKPDDPDASPSVLPSSSSSSLPKDSVDGDNKCVLESCNRPPKADSVYCSNECVLKHAQLSLKLMGKTDKDLEEHQIPGVSTTTLKSEPRVLVFEKSTGKILSGSEAPSLREVKTWLKEHPDYAVLQPGMMRTSGTVVTGVKADANTAGSAAFGKKVIQLSTQGSVPNVKTTPQKFTVVKSADGRIIVKASEALNKDIVNKLVPPTTTTPTAGKTVVVNSIKSPVVLGKPSVRDPESKASDSDTKDQDSTEEQNSESGRRTSESSSPIKKSNESSPPKRSVDSSTVKKNAESNPAKKNPENIPVKKLEAVSGKLSESPEVLPVKNVDSANSKNVESPTSKMPDTTTSSKVSSPVKDSKRIPVKPAASDPSVVRGSVKKTLADCLLKRSKESTAEFENLSEEDINELAEEIEKELFLFFGKDVGFKYKSRYRSLLFNIGDAKNSGLFRKILNGTISPANLAKMTSEELASKELAEWREREEKKELQAIEKYELDMIKLGNQYIMKSHKGEIEIDKDEFIKDKEKAPETINALPTDPVMGLLEDTTANHKNHVHDLNCKICTGQETSTSSLDMKYKGKGQEKKDNKDGKTGDVPKDRRDRKTSTDRDRKDKESHRHKSKDYDKDKKHRSDKSKEKDREETRGRSKSTDEKEKHKHRSRKDSERERERHKSSDKRERRDSKEKEDKERRHKHKKDRRDSKDDKDRKRRDSERSDRKRKHSESRSDDRKRRESEKTRPSESTDLEYDKVEREKDVVSTSDDVVIDLTRLRRESFSNLDADAKDSVPTSTVIGSPDITELKDDIGSPYPFNVIQGKSQDLLDSMGYNPPLPPGDEAPIQPPLPDSPPPHAGNATTPPLPDSPSTPPLPDSMVYSPKTPSLPDEFCLSPSSVVDDDDDDDDFPTTPPLPDDDVPKTPPLPTETDTTILYKDKGSLPTSSTEDLERLTPPLEMVHSTAPLPSPVPGKSTEPVIVWKGAIHMADISKFNASAFEVSGKSRFLPEDVPKVVDVVGRISPDTVWSYIAQTKKAGTKEILVVRFQPSNEEEKVSYIALYSYLSSKKRYGVIGNCEKAVKDFYIVPLASHQPIPQVLLPLDGPGFEEHRAHMLIGVIVRAKHRRIYDHITGTWQIVGASNSNQSKPSHKGSEEPERSYTPPLPTDQDIDDIALAATDSSDDDVKYEDRSTTPPIKKRSRDDDSPEIIHSGSQKRSARDQRESLQPKKRLSLDERLQSVAEALLPREPKSPVESSFAEGSLDQESMLAELNRQIEVHKKELSEMQKTVLNEEEEPYSPSRSGTDSPGDEPLKLDTSKINIPSNLQEILNNIKKKEEEIKNKELEIKRRMSLAADPIVMNYGKYEDSESKSISDSKASKHGDVDLRPMLRVKSESADSKEDEDLRIFQGKDSNEMPVNTEAFGKSDDTDLRVRDPRLARAHAAAVMEAIESGKTLKNLTDEELLAKALEMEGNENIKKQQPHQNLEAESMFDPVPPPPFMSSGFISQPSPMVPTNSMSCPQSIGMVGTPYVNQMGPPTQPVGMFGPPGGRNHGSQGPSHMPGPPGAHEPPGSYGSHRIQDRDSMGSCAPPPPMHDGPDLQGRDPHMLEPPQRYAEPSRYQEDWKRNYGDRDWEYNYDRRRGNNRYKGDHYRDRDRDRDWRRRQDHDENYHRQPYNRRNKQFDNRDVTRGSSSTSHSGDSGNYERNRDRFSEGRHRKKRYQEKHKNRNWGKYENMHRKNKGFDNTREGDKGLQEDEDEDDDCPYEIDY